MSGHLLFSPLKRGCWGLFFSLDQGCLGAPQSSPFSHKTAPRKQQSSGLCGPSRVDPGAWNVRSTPAPSGDVLGCPWPGHWPREGRGGQCAVHAQRRTGDRRRVLCVLLPFRVAWSFLWECHDALSELCQPSGTRFPALVLWAGYCIIIFKTFFAFITVFC